MKRIIITATLALGFAGGWLTAASGPYTLGWAQSATTLTVGLHRRPHGAQLAWVSLGEYGLQGGIW